MSKAKSLLGYEPAFNVDVELEKSTRWLEHKPSFSYDGLGSAILFPVVLRTMDRRTASACAPSLVSSRNAVSYRTWS